MQQAVRYEKNGHVGVITLDNPEKSNPLSLEVLQLLIGCFRESAARGDVCVIYRAEGKNFTFGADLKHGYRLITDPALRHEAVTDLWTWQELTTAMLEHPGVIIVGYHGWIVGGGFEHTLCSDLRVAADDTKIMMPELDLGIFYSNASTMILPRIVGEGRAKELMLLGDVLKAQTALEIGLVSRVCPRDDLDAVLREYAEKLASKDHFALRLARRVLRESRDGSIDDALYREGRAMIDTGKSGGPETRIGAFLKMNK